MHKERAQQRKGEGVRCNKLNVAGSRDGCRGNGSESQSVLKCEIKHQRSKLYLGQRGIEDVHVGRYLSSLS